MGKSYADLGERKEGAGHLATGKALYMSLGKADKYAALQRDMVVAKHVAHKSDEDLKRLKEAHAIHISLGNEEIAAQEALDIGHAYMAQGQYDPAIEYFKEAWTAFERLGIQTLTVRRMIASAYVKSVRFDEASEVLNALLASVGKVHGEIETAALMGHIADIEKEMQRHDDALKHYGKALELYRAAGAENRVAETLHAMGLIETFLGKDITAIFKFREAVEIFRRLGLERDYAMAIFGDMRWYKYAADAADEFASMRAVKIVEREKMPERSRSVNDGCSCDAIINYYRMLLTADPSKTRGAAVRMRGVKTREEEIREIAKILYRLFVKPIEGAIKGKRDIIIVPDGPLAFLPFETLINDDGKYMAELYDIRYVQSIGVMELLKRRNYDYTRHPIVAFGSPIYNRGTYNLEMAEAGALYASRSSGEAGKGALAANPYSFFDPEAAGNLPASLVEVNSLMLVFDRPRVFTGEAATETNVKALSASGELEKYKVIHFAAHAFILQAAPRLSAIVLSLPKVKTDTDDGFLSLDEIASLKLKADFVNLSACETGLGKLYDGEGVVGFTHAFLVAGANALSVSLWQVSDASTAIFMKGIYKETAMEGFGYSRAISEMKRRFIRGDFGAAHTAPFYWAPFVYYGR